MGVPTDPAAPAGRQWRRIGTDRRLGIAVPLFSLRSSRSAGIGDVADLEMLVDWCVEIGASVVQLLPLNDLGTDSAPYCAISAFALDPVHVALDRLDEVQRDAALRDRVRGLSQVLERAPRVDYTAVRREKMAVLEAAFAVGREALSDAAGFEGFVAANRDWLEDYVLYRTLREENGWASRESWGPDYAGADARAAFAGEHAERLQFHRWVQWTLDRQLSAARAYAQARGVLLKGDIPILVGRDSADVWCHPEIFRLDTGAGAPPDYYAEDGQNWGFPTYDWPTLWDDDCRWWRRRLEVAERYFDLYRVDHVVGLFRIWTVPQGEKTARNGVFVPADEAEWGAHGRRILEMMLAAADMLPLAEDLGTIPDVCRETLVDLGICGLKVARWEKRYKSDGRFIPPAAFPALSVATLSTHDSETLRGWWQAEPTERQELYETLGRRGQAPEHLTPDLHEELLRQIAQSGAIFAILAIQDVLAPYGQVWDDPEANRVNIPGLVNGSNWTFRLPVPLESLIENTRLNERLRDLLRRS